MTNVPNEISVQTVRNFILYKGGTVSNQQLVRHFKSLLTDPSNKSEARYQFKKIVNQIANVKEENGEKYLTLKKSYRHNEESSSRAYGGGTSPALSLNLSVDEPISPSVTIPKYSAPPPYREPPPVLSPVSPRTVDTSADCYGDLPPESPPPVPPRRKSSSSLKDDNGNRFQHPEKETVDAVLKKNELKEEQQNSDSLGQEQFSVKECMKKFHRLASQDNTPPKLYQPVSHSMAQRKRISDKTCSDRDDDTDSTNSLDQRYKDWIVRAARGDYQELAKLASENHKLPKYKDPATGYTALHWGVKHGNMDIVKLIAGTYGVNVNLRTNGGYTPLHIAMQFGHEDVYNLLVEVYGADQNLRDWSGRKPRQYQIKNTTVSSDIYRHMKGQKKHSEKDSGFLRMGSLNVKVKKTTEVVSNFLGVGNHNPDKLHKMWSSADNIEDYSRMPPPKVSTLKKRKSKTGRDYKGHHKYPSSPTIAASSKVKRTTNDKSDSDSSDTTSGFDSSWRAK